MHPLSNSRGFTLVELMVSMSIGTVIMLAVFTTYNYLGRNLTRLSYQNILEAQSRKFLATLASDIQKTKSVTAASSTNLSLKLFDGSLVDYTFDAGTGKISRDPDGPGPAASAIFNYDIGDANVQVPVTIPSFSFIYYTTNGGSPSSQFSSPAPPITPISVKQLAITFTLQAGAAAVQGQLGTLTIRQVTSGRMNLLNRQLPDGS